jgi:hypothetical protein
MEEGKAGWGRLVWISQVGKLRLQVFELGEFTLRQGIYNVPQLAANLTGTTRQVGLPGLTQILQGEE